MALYRILLLMGCALFYSGWALAQDACEGEVGAAYGICVTYCDVLDCDGDDPIVPAKACDAVQKRYEKFTGKEWLPCEQVPLDFCPCYDQFTDAYDWAWFAPTDQYCIDNPATCCVVDTGMMVVMTDWSRSLHSYGPGATVRCEGGWVGNSFSVPYSDDAEIANFEHTACSALIRNVQAAMNYGACP